MRLGIRVFWERTGKAGVSPRGYQTRKAALCQESLGERPSVGRSARWRNLAQRRSPQKEWGKGFPVWHEGPGRWGEYLRLEPMKMSEKEVPCPEARCMLLARANGLEPPRGDVGGLWCFPEAEDKTKEHSHASGLMCVRRNRVRRVGGLSEALTSPWVKVQMGTGFLIIKSKPM